MKKIILLSLLSAMALSCGSSMGALNKDKTHVDKKETLKKGEYFPFEITLEDKMASIEVSGEWRVNDGGDRKANVFVLDEENYLKYEKDEACKKQYESGAKINDNFKIRLLNQYKSAKTIYYLIFENPSEDDEKEIEFKLDLDYEWGAGTRN